MNYDAWIDYLWLAENEIIRKTFERVISNVPPAAQHRRNTPATVLLPLDDLRSVIYESVVKDGWEEVLEFIFPEDEMASPNLKLPAAPKDWKRQQKVPILLHTLYIYESWTVISQ